jgi:hypothetical protein
MAQRAFQSLAVHLDNGGYDFFVIRWIDEQPLRAVPNQS